MTKGNTLSRLLIASLTAAAVAAPAATAQPVEPVPMTPNAAPNQQLQGEAAKDQAPAPSPHQQLQGEAAKDPSRAPAPAVEPVPGPPTWPVNPEPIAPPAAPVADDGDGGGIEAPVLALIIAGGLALAGGLAAAALRHRTPVAH
jgi:hypothetical protein